MANNNLVDALREIADLYGVDEFDLLDKLEDRLKEVYMRTLRLTNECRVTIDRETGNVYVYELVCPDDAELDENDEPICEEIDVTPHDVSRLAALEAKKTVGEIVREASLARIREHYRGLIGEMATGRYQNSRHNQFMILKLDDGLDVELPDKERPERERYAPNDPIKVYILEVRDSKKNEPPVVVSRKHPNLLKRLFEIEVPEVGDGVVEIKSIAREAGVRSKVAVYSRQEGLDPVGACVGPSGSRVRSVVTELKGERIDVIPWSDDPATFVASALSPAKVVRVIIDESTHTANIVVAPDQLSLAIGKEGQNARLAAQLTGWRIDIKSTEMAAAAGLIPTIATMDDLGEIDTHCIAVNADGHRCRNHARPGSQYCGVHEKESD